MSKIKSILDTDLYKFSMSYAYQQLFPRATGIFTFCDRSDSDYTPEFVEKLKMAVAEMSFLSLKSEEFRFMSSTCEYIPVHYWEWLSSFMYDPNDIEIKLVNGSKLFVQTKEMLLSKATLWEVSMLALISELKNEDNKIVMSDIISRLEPKISLSNQEGIRFSEFGTRRRFSYNVQAAVVSRLANDACHMTGTSNCHLAHINNIKPIGTQAHEWFMFHGAIFGYKQANWLALENWSNVYDGDLGIALSDTYTSDVFFENFSKKHAKLWDGVRQDSGDEFKFVMKTIDRYKKLGIDPTTKTIIFSNALDFEKAKEINEYCGNRIRCAFGIGTNLTNDTGHKPSNIVMKLTHCRIAPGKPLRECVKLSDDYGKYTGEKEEVELCKKTLKI